jgi:hypothetical protein
MKQTKLDWIISLIREQMGGATPTMSTGSTSSAAGFSSAADPKGPVAGYDKVMGFTRRKKIIGLGKGSRNRWKPKKQSQ